VALVEHLGSTLVDARRNRPVRSRPTPQFADSPVR
jgi:hypothetical protein